jgi:hypothetical protein
MAWMAGTEAGCFRFLEFALRANSERRKTAGMPFFARARDRSGIFAEQKLERIARFFAASPQKMRPPYIWDFPAWEVLSRGQKRLTGPATPA